MPRYTSSYFASGSYLDMVSPLSSSCERSSCPRGYPSHVTNVTAKASRPTRLLQADRALEVPCAPLTKKSSLSSAASLNPQTAFQQENSFHSHHASQIHYEIS